MAPIPKRRTERAPPIQKLLKPAIIVVIAFFAYYVKKGIELEITRINPSTDSFVLKQIMQEEAISDDTYAVLCLKQDTTHVSSVFTEAATEFSGPTSVVNGVKFVLLDCDSEIETAAADDEEAPNTTTTTIAKKLSLNLKTYPTVFVSTAGKVKQVPAKHLKTGDMLVKAIKSLIIPAPTKIDTTAKLKSLCLDKEYCALLLRGAKATDSFKDELSSLTAEFKKILPVVYVDTINQAILNLEDTVLSLPEYNEGRHRFVLFHKISGSSTDAKKGRLITSVAAVKGTNLNLGNLSNFLNSRSTHNFEKLSTLPSITRRSKKTHEKIRAKRVKKREQKQKQKESEEEEEESTETQSSSSSSGSRADRKAERDRRRAEHHAKHNVKPKTPEELKAQEAARRKRMQEEAEKWNMMPDDEDLDDITDGRSSSSSRSDGGGGSYFEEEFDQEEYIVDIDGGEDDDDDEDEEILDLD